MRLVVPTTENRTVGYRGSSKRWLRLADAAKGVKSERNQPFGRMGIGRMIKRAGEAASELASVCSAFARSINLPNINAACEYLLDAQGCFV